MLIIAVVFVFCALACPTMGRVFYIGSFRFDAHAARVFYGIYALVMFGLFAASFCVKKE